MKNSCLFFLFLFAMLLLVFLPSCNIFPRDTSFTDTTTTTAITTTTTIGRYLTGLLYHNVLDTTNDIYFPELGSEGIMEKLATEIAFVTLGKSGGSLHNVDHLTPYSGQDYSMDAVYLPSSGLTTQKGTVQFWFKPDWDTTSDNGLARTIIGTTQFVTEKYLRGKFPSLAGIDFQWSGPTKRFNFVLFKRNSAGTDNEWINNFYISNSKLSLYNGEWTHISLVWDKDGIDSSTKTMAVYKNGFEVDSTDDIIPDRIHFAGYLSIGNAGSHWFYAVHTDLNINNTCQGSIDELKLFNHARTDYQDLSLD